MSEAEIAVTLIVRWTNALIWTVVAVRILTHDRPVSALARRVISLVLIFGMWTLAIGGLTTIGFDGAIARMLYTAFTAFAAIAGLGIVFDPWADEAVEDNTDHG